MFDLLLVPLAVVYLSVVLLLCAYGINFFYLCFLTWQHRAQKSDSPALEDLPFVTVQLPLYNELYVAERLVDAAAHLDYPRNQLEIQVLDDSTDETSEVIGRTVSRLQRHGLNISHLRRDERKGFKAGALAHGMESARGEFFAFFDSDFVPPPDFLKRTLPHFADHHVAFVQTRWGHFNQDYSLLTLLQSLAIDAHFMVEQFARACGMYWFNFNGTAGVWRRAALDDAGGWTADTLTEDLDISYRAFLRGWRGVYLRDVVTRAELPVNFSAYRRQQHRWAQGSLECALKLIPRVWDANIPIRHKLQATLHLTGYCVHLLMLLLAFLYPIALTFSEQFPGLVSLFGIATIFNMTAFAPTLFFTFAQSQLGRSWWRSFPATLFMTALGAGMMLNTLRAAQRIVLKRKAVFERTPKFGIEHRQQDWLRRRYQLRLDPIVFPELGFALFNLGTVVLAISLGNWLIALYAAFFATGLFFTSGLSIAQTIAIHRTSHPAVVPTAAVQAQ